MTERPTTRATASGKLELKKTASFSGIRADILMGGEADPMTVMSMTVAPNHGAPDHISHLEDKLFQIMEGDLIFSVGTERIEVSAGEQIFVGRGVSHSFSAINVKPAKMTLFATPSKHDRFFIAMGDLDLPHDMHEVQKVCERFDQSIVGPVIQ